MSSKPLKFEEMMPHFHVGGHVHVSEGSYKPDEYPCECPTDVDHNSPCFITTKQELCIEAKWHANGKLAKFLAGNWKLTVDGEKWGKEEPCIEKMEVVEYKCGDDLHFSKKITFGPGELSPGFYKMVLCLTFCACDGTPGPIAAFVECPPIKVYDAH